MTMVWTQRMIVERLRAWAVSHGGYAPLDTDWQARGHQDWAEGEWPSSLAVTRRFGSWALALEAAGVTPHPDHRRSWTREQVIQKLREWADTHDGEAPIAMDWAGSSNNPERQAGEWPVADTVLEFFPSWDDALDAAGVMPRERHSPGGTERWPAARIVERLQTWAAAHGGYAPLHTDWGRQGHPDWEPNLWPHANTVTRVWASWENAVQAAEVTPHPEHLPKWTREVIIERIRRWAIAHAGEGPICADWSPGSSNPTWQRGEWPNASTVLRHFDSWDAALQAAGVAKPNTIVPRRWTREAMLERLQTWAAAHGGYGPRQPDWETDGHGDWEPNVWPSVSRIRAEFGSWSGALAAAGVPARPREPRSVRRWTRDVIVERLRAWAAEHAGEAPRSTDWHGSGHPDWSPGNWPSASVVQTVFGGWEAALDAAGLTARSGREPAQE
jgi:hypothetical protein